MKALSLWQPWATLIALGVKTIETRSWGTTYRGPIAIHAAKHKPEPVGDMIGDWIVDWGLHHSHSGFTNGGFNEGRGYLLRDSEYNIVPLPLGCIVATATLTDCVPMLDIDAELDVAWMPHVAGTRGGDRHLALWRGPSDTDGPMGRPTWVTSDIEDQRPYGDFTPGRWAWLLDDITPLADPIPARGRQQLFEWEAPALVASGQIGAADGD